MIVKIFNWIFVLAGFVADAAFILGILFSPFALYKGFDKKDWKFGKIAAIMISGGLVVTIVCLLGIVFIGSLK